MICKSKSKKRLDCGMRRPQNGSTLQTRKIEWHLFTWTTLSHCGPQMGPSVSVHTKHRKSMDGFQFLCENFPVNGKMLGQFEIFVRSEKQLFLVRSGIGHDDHNILGTWAILGHTIQKEVVVWVVIDVASHVEMTKKGKLLYTWARYWRRGHLNITTSMT